MGSVCARVACHPLSGLTKYTAVDTILNLSSVRTHLGLLPFCPTASAAMTVIPSQAAATHWASALSPECAHTLLIQP